MMGTRASIWWTRAKLLALALLLAPALVFLVADVAHAAPFTVNSTGDSPDWNPRDGVCDIGSATRIECTLRAAIQQANATSGSDTIDFSVTGEITLSNTPGRGGLEIGAGENLTINGPGANALAINGSDQVRPFKIDSTVDSTALVEINGLTIANGRVVAGNGAGIDNEGELTLNDSVVRDSSASGVGDDGFSKGGGIHNTGTLTLNRSTVSGNFGDLGGGINNRVSSTMRVNRSTVSSNNSGFGGGGILNEGDLTLSGSTVSSNRANSSGGGILSLTGSDGVANINNSTISGNNAADDSNFGPGSNGGGMYLEGTNGIFHSTITNNDIVHSAETGNGVASEGSAGTVTFVRASIISGNADNSDVALDGGSTNSFGSQGYNLIGGGDAVGAFDGTRDLTEVTDPLLAPLANYGGPTSTHALLAGSRAIDSAGPNPPAADQRGVARPKDGDANGSSVADIGSYEKEPRPPNDDLAGSRAITGASTQVNGKNIEATRQAGEPDHLPSAGSLGENSLWYRWTAPASGRVSLDTCTSSFDTVLAVYTGGSLGSLSQVASDDDSCDAPNANGSKLTFNAVAGTAYRIAASGYFVSSKGTFTLRLRDLTAPTVTRVVPADRATGVARTANVTATFSEAMDRSTLTTTTFTLKRGTTTVPAVVTYDATLKRATLNPNANLVAGATYTATVTAGAKDVAGNALDQNPATAGNQARTWRFTVR